MPKRNTTLFLAANPAGTTKLAVEEECRTVERELRAASMRDNIEFHPRFAPTLGLALQLLNEMGPTIVHFCGHGERDGLIFHSETNSKDLVTAEEIATVFNSLAVPVRLVVMNACYSARQAERLVEHVDHIVGMSRMIHDRPAAVFAKGFYGALGNGVGIRDAVAQATLAMSHAGLPGAQDVRHLTRKGVDENGEVLDVLVGLPSAPGLAKLIETGCVDAALQEELVRHARLSTDSELVVALIVRALSAKEDPTERYWLYQVLGRIGGPSAREALAAAEESDPFAAKGINDARKAMNIV